ncbi:YoaK family protein [Massilia sp. PWRC2]|uniref:YoaK family protein n=1 Tax=Massilia sp. PWRC2 TaxID=2804626 RepID=UPI003CFAB71D
MPVQFARTLAGAQRVQRANQQLGMVLAFIAGALNAGGFLAVKQYTSHMTGIVSAMADNAVLGHSNAIPLGLAALGAFVIGAAVSSLMVNFARRRQLHSQYAMPLMLEALLLLCFGVVGAQLNERHPLTLPFTMALLCFVMGLQNALITKLSGAEIRTTHITGIVTDIGIELGRMFYWHSGRHDDLPPVHADRAHLRLLFGLAGCFTAGAFMGAYGFRYVGYATTLPLAALLLALAAVPMMDDVRNYRRRPLA